MKREADNNRVKRAIEHITAAQTNLNSIKDIDRTRIEDGVIDIVMQWMDTIKKKLSRLATVVLLMVAVSAKGQTTEQVRAELQRQGVPHADIVLAQARLETGNFTSRRCKQDHNLFGIKHRGKYARYATWQASVADYKQRISSRYKQGENYYSFLRRIHYAEDGAYLKKIQNIVNTSR